MAPQYSHTALNPRVSPKIKWDDYMKLFICILYRVYVANWAKFTRLFNYAFAESLLAAGFTDGTRAGPLVSQVSHLKHWKDRIWTRVYDTHPNQWVRLAMFVETIELVAERGHIRLTVCSGIDIQRLEECGQDIADYQYPTALQLIQESSLD
ncbi:uncharacterized protein GIQ15_05983 [Arthroderma uncinatum]|uniref:uncharacterized protein n=1 Tax=Arthroderma uncinatum TaxID=74035 RepID=UPI00144AC1E1|nr:uncharacterized protein GIQ15_05983 [Arthroderma uncinatum]KAF3480636.1 hypothetical protein GIQ15_05983 [Arthroderma uncinatum]